MDDLKQTTQEWMEAYEPDTIPRMKTTITITTRERTDRLACLLKSIATKTHDMDNVSVIVSYDDDDKDTMYLMMEARSKNTYPFPIVERCVPRSVMHGRDYWNPMAAMAAKNSDVIWGLCDDAEILTDGWDSIVRRKLMERPNEHAWYIGVEDSTPQPSGFPFPAPPYCTMPMLTRSAYEAAGFFMLPSIATWGNDLALYMIWAHPSVNRTMGIPEIVFAHHCQHNNTLGQDGVNKRVEQIYRGNAYEINRVMNVDVPIHAARIARTLKEKGI